ncbi:MAG TPA: hypothetical protein VEA79_04910, partial [Phenylobacterium sp.]|nr:hypothetical protein [Phenylobacterium sp.]
MKRELKPYVGQREDGQEVADEVEHFYRCKACGQLVDKRDLAAVFHHEERGHAPLAAEEAYRLVGVDHQVAAATAKPRRRRRASAPMSAFQMFAFPKLVDKAPEGLGWIHEIKYDGYRMQLRVEGGQARLFTRNGYDWTSKLHLLAAHAGVALDADCLLDAELCAIGEDGVPSFELLQSRKPTSHLVLFVFDALWIGGEDLRDRPLVERKARLAALLEAAGSKRLRYVDHFTDAVGAHALFQAACDMKLE